MNGINTASPTFTAPSNIPSDTQLKFALTAKDDKGATNNNPAIVTITVKHINRPPIANAGTDQTVNPGYVVTLDGTKSKDSDSSDTLTYSWVQTAGPTVILNGVNSPIATFTAPSNNISADTTLMFKLAVTDDKNATGVDDVKVTVKYVPPPNQPPVANAGSDQTVNAGNTVTLNASGSRDPDGTIKSYSWKQIGGPAVTLNGADTSTPTLTAQPNISTSTVLVFGLTVTDSKNATGISTVKINVNPVNHPPVASAGSDQTVNAGDTVTLDGWGSTEADGNMLLPYYSWTQTAGPAVTLSNATPANAASPTFTAPSVSSDTTLKFSLTVKDNNGTASNNPATVSVTVKATTAAPSAGNMTAAEPSYGGGVGATRNKSTRLIRNKS